MRAMPSIAWIVGVACLLAAPARAAPATAAPAGAAAAYQRNLTCAAAMAALSARLPPTSSDKAKQDAHEGMLRERTLAVDAGKSLGVSEPEIDRLIAQKRDEIATRAEKSGSAGKINRDLFIRTIECELDQLGDAIKKAKAAKAAGAVK